MPADIDALNYPYIRIRSADWLKRTLLIFPHVVRMTPVSNAPGDDPAIIEFCRYEGPRSPLLRSADLFAPHVEKAQMDLIEELDTMFGYKDSLLRRFQKRSLSRRFQSQHPDSGDGGQTASQLTVWEQRLSNHGTFQIHREKMLETLVRYLRKHKLAWEPDARYSDGFEYLEMNPRLGEAVMATLAVACAENEGLQVVTEFPELHGELIGTPRSAILRACLQPAEANGRTSAQQVAEFLVYRRCDVTELTAERIAALKSEREALADFPTEIEKLALTLPPEIHNEAILRERLNDLMQDIFRKWQSDQANLSNYARRLFGDDWLSEPEKLLQKLVESAVKSEGSAGAATGAAAAAAAKIAGPLVGGLTIPILAGAAAGFLVAVVFRAVRVWGETTKAARQSPYRYLTALEEQGVSFSLSTGAA